MSLKPEEHDSTKKILKKIAPDAVGQGAGLVAKAGTHVALHVAANALLPGLGFAISIPASIVIGEAVGWLAETTAKKGTQCSLDLLSAVGKKVNENLNKIAGEFAINKPASQITQADSSHENRTISHRTNGLQLRK